MKKLMFTFATFALALASAASTHRITLFQPSTVNGKELKPGDYKVEVLDSKVVISKGKETVEAPVKVETGTGKFDSTSVRYSGDGGKLVVQEIRLGGTNTKLVFSN